MFTLHEHGGSSFYNASQRYINGWLLPPGSPRDFQSYAAEIDEIMHVEGIGRDETFMTIVWHCESGGWFQPLQCDSNYYSAANRRNMEILEQEFSFVQSVVGNGFLPGPQSLRPPSSGLTNPSRPAVPGGAPPPLRPGGRCPNSFVPGTAVLMADGTHKPIEEIGVGDLVLATDPETGVTEAQPVMDTITGTGEKILVEITITAGYLRSTSPATTAEHAAPSSVTATDNHPFWNATDNTWTNAADLELGDQLLTTTGGHVTATATTTSEKILTVHNLTVSDSHTYYVIAGNTPILVSNANGCNVSPTTPTGSNGNPLLTRTPNQPAVINGRQYSGHALDRMQQQGIMPSVVDSATRGPAIPGKRLARPRTTMSTATFL